MPLPIQTQKLHQWLLLNKVRQWFTPLRQRILWNWVTVVSLVLLSIGMVYTWYELPQTELQVKPIYLGVAVIIYATTYVMHLFGWQALASLVFGPLPLRENVEAVAASDLVKYLPTVAWYIANRIRFYNQRQIKRGAVIAASLLEMMTLVGSGVIIYLILWLSRASSWFWVLGLLLVVLIVLKLAGQKLTHWWHTRIASYQMTTHPKPYLWITAFFWYGISWLGGAFFLAVILRAFVPIEAVNYSLLLKIWLISGLTGTIVSLTFGTIGIARETTLTFLLAQYWPLPVSVAAAVFVKIILTIGQITCALLILSWLHFRQRIYK
ncbi:MAG: hypothetical protein ACE5E7_06440 [Anaerolineae bacterium]